MFSSMRVQLNTMLKTETGFSTGSSTGCTRYKYVSSGSLASNFHKWPQTCTIKYKLLWEDTFLCASWLMKWTLTSWVGNYKIRQQSEAKGGIHFPHLTAWRSNSLSRAEVRNNSPLWKVWHRNKTMRTIELWRQGQVGTGREKRLYLWLLYSI